MNIAKAKILGSPYIGLFAIANDSLCFAPPSLDDKTARVIETTLNAKVIKTGLYSSALLAVFAKMNNRRAFVPSFISSAELAVIEREIKVTVLDTPHAIGNLIELNDTGCVASQTLPKKIAETLAATGLAVAHTNLAKTEVVGSSLVATTLGFVASPAITREEADLITKTLGVAGGSASANTGDAFVRNSILANRHGFLVGENTSPYEIAKIEEALLGEGTLTSAGKKGL